MRTSGSSRADPSKLTVLTFWSLEAAYPKGGKLRYHLGQLGMTRLMNRLAEKGCLVQALICDATSRSVIGHGTDGALKDIEVTRAFMNQMHEFIQFQGDESDAEQAGHGQPLHGRAQAFARFSPVFRKRPGTAQ